MTNYGTFCTVFDCMDGRCQEPTNNWIKEHMKDIDYPDTITDAGICRVLAYGNAVEVSQAKARAEISTEKHGSHKAVVVGHAECAGNPVSDEKQREDIAKAAQAIKDWGMFDEVIGLFEGGNEDAHKWGVEEVSRVK